MKTAADLRSLPRTGVVDLDGLHAVDHLPDPAREPARGELALAPETQQLAAHARDDDELDADHAAGQDAEPHALDQDEQERRDRLRAEQNRLDEGVADEPADRLDLVLDDGGGL